MLPVFHRTPTCPSELNLPELWSAMLGGRK